MAARVSRSLRDSRRRFLRLRRTTGPRDQHNGCVPLPRLAWLVTVAVAVLTGLIVLLNGYTGYGVLSFVIAASAAINLR